MTGRRRYSARLAEVKGPPYFDTQEITPIEVRWINGRIDPGYRFEDGGWEFAWNVEVDDESPTV